jgi:hypothetical protein
MTAATLHGDYRIECAYLNLTEALRNEIINFWLLKGALWDTHEARKRVDEVVFVVHDLADHVVGVSTVIPARYGPDRDVYLNYRMFIDPAHRVPGLMKAVLRATRCFFDRTPDCRASARGMLIYAENPKLRRQGIRRMFERSVWEYAGQDHRGLDVWRFDFTS